MFLLLGETNVIMYTTLPPTDGPSIDSFVYGSRLVPLERHGARVRRLSVDGTGSVLASGDDRGRCRVWPLRAQGAGDGIKQPSSVSLGGFEPPPAPVVPVEIQAHRGPILALAHGHGQSAGRPARRTPRLASRVPAAPVCLHPSMRAVLGLA
jgi:hypothetical protein